MARYRFGETNTALFRDEAKEQKEEDIFLYLKSIRAGRWILLAAISLLFFGFLIFLFMAKDDGYTFNEVLNLLLLGT